MRAKLAPDSYPAESDLQRLTKLPAQGQSVEWIERQIKALRGLEKGDVQAGRVSGAVYHVSCRSAAMRDVLMRRKGRRRLEQGDRACDRWLRSLQPSPSRRFPWREKDGVGSRENVSRSVSLSVLTELS